MIYIIIPNYNGWHLLENCLLSLKNQINNERKIIVVDNASNDFSVKSLKEIYPEVKIIELDDNYGFAKAVNLGIKCALKDELTSHIILLNNDVECEKDFITQILNGFISDDIGSVACKMINYYDRTIIDDAGDFINSKGFPAMRGYEEKDMGQYDKPELIFGACAGAAAYKREVFEEVGYFDESFFAYFEDVDFSCRLQLQGYKCYYFPKALCYHKRGATSGIKSLFSVYLVEKNINAYKIKNFPIEILRKYWFRYFLQRLKRFYLYWKTGSFKLVFSALKGYMMGMFLTGKYIKMRKNIQNKIKVPKEYIFKIFEFN